MMKYRLDVLFFCDGMLISKAHNCREVTNNSIMHAEIVAISDACEKTL